MRFSDTRDIALLRALSGNEPQTSEETLAKGGGVPVWWGPVLKARPGDRIVYVDTPLGIMVEGVDRTVRLREIRRVEA